MPAEAHPSIPEALSIVLCVNVCMYWHWHWHWHWWKESSCWKETQDFLCEGSSDFVTMM